jgi:large subunit ribosomal protein L17
MPTPRKSKRFGGDAAHQRLMLANLAVSLFAAEAIVTTEAKARARRPRAEKLITKAKKAQDEGSPAQVHQLRQIQGFLGDREMTHKLTNEVAPRDVECNGGYTRILKLGTRRADRAEMARIELV